MNEVFRVPVPSGGQVVRERGVGDDAVYFFVFFDSCSAF